MKEITIEPKHSNVLVRNSQYLGISSQLNVPRVSLKARPDQRALSRRDGKPAFSLPMRLSELGKEVLDTLDSLNSSGQADHINQSGLQHDTEDITEDSFYQELLKQLSSRTAEASAEKVYLHLDKDFYGSGETIWFKAFVLNLQTLNPDNMSSVLYVDLSNSKGEVIFHGRFPVDEYGAAASIDLPENLVSGYYRLKSYTHWMKNYSSEFFYDELIRIYNPNDLDHDKELERREPDFDLQFFPEGGTLITGISTQIAFRATDQDGLGIDISGKIVGETNSFVTEIHTRYDGMGGFFVLPQKERLRAIVEYQGMTKEFLLPKPEEEGYSLSVNNLNDNSLQVKIRSTESFFGKEIFLVGQSRGGLYHFEKIRIMNGSSFFQIDKLKLPQGIFQLTIFDNAYNPVCERVVFVRKDQQIQKDLSLKDPLIYARKKIEMSVRLTDGYGQPIRGGIVSVSITDKDHQSKEVKTDNIQSNLYLLSNMKGYLDNPGFYFMATDRDTNIALDLAVLTHEWRKIVWRSRYITDSNPSIYLHESGNVISGKAFKSGSDDVFTNGFITIFSLDETHPGVWRTTTDNFGNFSLFGFPILDSIKVMTKSIDQKGRMSWVDLVIDKSEPFPDIKPISINKRLPWDENIEYYLEKVRGRSKIAESLKLKDQLLLKEVVVTSRRYNNSYYGTPDAVIIMSDDMPVFNNIFDLLRGRVAGVRVMGSGMNATVNIRGSGGLGGQYPPLFLLDGTPIISGFSSVTDQETYTSIINPILMSINPNDIERIDVLKNPGTIGVFGMRGVNGVISIITKSEIKREDNSISKGFGELTITNYSSVREFTARAYDDPEKSHVLPDMRTSLYWNPHTVINDQGMIEIEFFNSDEAKRFQIEVQGVTESGIPFYFLENIGQEASE